MGTQLAYQLAYDAIEAYVADHHARDRGAWQEITPTNEWGYTVDAWEGPASDIVARYNDLLPNGQSIDVPRSAKRNSADKPLIEFQLYLANKATALSVAEPIQSMES